MQHGLARIDAKGVHAYLESSNPRNVPSTNATASTCCARSGRADSPPVFPRCYGCRGEHGGFRWVSWMEKSPSSRGPRRDGTGNGEALRRGGRQCSSVAASSSLDAAGPSDRAQRHRRPGRRRQPPDLDRLYKRVRDTHGASTSSMPAPASVSCLPRGGERDHFDRIFAVNVRGALSRSRRLCRYSATGASVIMTGSIASIKGFERFGVYNASKGRTALVRRTWANELKGRNIRVNVLIPGTIGRDFEPHSQRGQSPVRGPHPAGHDRSARGIATVALFWPRTTRASQRPSSCS